MKRVRSEDLTKASLPNNEQGIINQRSWCSYAINTIKSVLPFGVSQTLFKRTCTEYAKAYLPKDIWTNILFHCDLQTILTVRLVAVMHRDAASAKEADSLTSPLAFRAAVAFEHAQVYPHIELSIKDKFEFLQKENATINISISMKDFINPSSMLSSIAEDKLTIVVKIRNVREIRQFRKLLSKEPRGKFVEKVKTLDFKELVIDDRVHNSIDRLLDAIVVCLPNIPTFIIQELPANCNVEKLLDQIGTFYWETSRREDSVSIALKYNMQALEMRQSLFPGSHRDIVDSLNHVGFCYEELGKKLGKKENICKGLDYLEQSIKMMQEFFPDGCHDIVDLYSYIGKSYFELGSKEDLYKALECHMAALRIGRKLSPARCSTIANTLASIGDTYKALGEEKDIQKGLKFLEQSLKLIQVLCRKNTAYHTERYQSQTGGIYFKRILTEIHSHRGNMEDMAKLLDKIGNVYLELNDQNKALEYFKQSFGIYSEILDLCHDDEDHGVDIRTESLKLKIESLQSNFFVSYEQSEELQSQDYRGIKIGSEYRWLIMSRGEIKDDIIIVKQKVQKEVLDIVVESVETYGWSSAGSFGYDWGVKGYLHEQYLSSKLGELRNKSENIELAQMLCFEAMNLGIIKAQKKPYEVAESFAKANPRLVKKIAQEHPEFFVDGSIVEACIRAMPDQESKEYIFSHIEYIMKERIKKGLISI